MVIGGGGWAESAPRRRRGRGGGGGGGTFVRRSAVAAVRWRRRGGGARRGEEEEETKWRRCAFRCPCLPVIPVARPRDSRGGGGGGGVRWRCNCNSKETGRPPPSMSSEAAVSAAVVARGCIAVTGIAARCRAVLDPFLLRCRSVLLSAVRPLQLPVPSTLRSYCRDRSRRAGASPTAVWQRPSRSTRSRTARVDISGIGRSLASARPARGGAGKFPFARCCDNLSGEARGAILSLSIGVPLPAGRAGAATSTSKVPLLTVTVGAMQPIQSERVVPPLQAHE